MSKSGIKVLIFKNNSIYRTKYSYENEFSLHWTERTTNAIQNKKQILKSIAVKFSRLMKKKFISRQRSRHYFGSHHSLDKYVGLVAETAIRFQLLPIYF